MNADRNLLFGVLALRADLIDADQLAQAFEECASHPGASLADVLIQRGWLSATECADVERHLERKLRKHGGDLRASLTDAGGEVLSSLATCIDPSAGKNVSFDCLSTGREPTDSLPFVPPTRARYSLTRLHATGGIGRVWLAHDDVLGRDVALKELRSDHEDLSAHWGRFVREARVTGQLEHPGIVPVYELSERPGSRQPFYVMRFVQGQTFSTAVAAFHADRRGHRAGALRLSNLLNAFVAVCNAIAFAHARGVVHRDLKGQNVVLGEFGEVIVLDWGLAKVMGQSGQLDGSTPVSPGRDGEETQTAEGQVMGTPAYLAPEQAAGRVDQIDARTDVYGLGALLYEILTGRPPFTGLGLFETLRQVQEEAPTRPRSLWPGVPRALEAICLKALAKQPENRYADARALADEVRRYLADEPVQVYREPLPARAARWMRRHKPLVSGAAALLVAGVAALAIGTVLIGEQKARAVDNFHKAEAERIRADGNFRLAHDAADRYFVQVSESKLLGVPGMQPLRKELLTLARDYYQKFVEQRVGDPALRADLAWAYYRLGWATGAIESKDKGIELLQKSVGLFRELTRTEGDTVANRRALAQCHNALGELYRGTNRVEQAAANFTEAIRGWNELAGEFPRDEAFPTQEAATLLNLGRLYTDVHQWNKADEELAKAIAAWQRLADAHPQNAGYRTSLGWCYYNQAKVYRGKGQIPRAEETFLTMIDVYKPLTGTREEAEFPYALASAFHDYAGLLFDLGRRKESKGFYEKALGVYQRAARRDPLVPLYRRDLAACYHDLGNVHLADRNLKEAKAAYEKSREIEQELVDAYPDEPDHLLHLAGTYYNFGLFYKDLGRSDDADKAFTRALELQTSLVERYKDDPRYLSSQAASRNSLGFLRLQADRWKEARNFLEPSRDAFRMLANKYPGVPEYKAGLARALHNLGIVHRGAQRPDEALAAHREAGTHYQELVHQNENVPTYRGELAATWDALGSLQRATGHPADAVASLEQATALRQQILDRKENDLHARSDLGGTLNNLAMALAANGQHTDALTRYQQAIEHQRFALNRAPEVFQYRSYLSNHYVNRFCLYRELNRPAESAADALEVLNLWPKNPEREFRCSVDLALCIPLVGKGKTELNEEERAERCRYEDEAMKAIKQAVANGFKDADRLRKAPELEPLRQRADFKELLAQLEAKK
jgi:serine/threonine-protein kinase